MILVRFADDFVAGFQHRADAERFLADLRERFAEFGLELAAEKTRLIEFGRFAARDRAARGQRRPETFQFLGFTHICAKTRNGRFKLKRITTQKRLRAKLRAVKTELRDAGTCPSPTKGAGWPAWCKGTTTTTPCPTTSRRYAPSENRSSGAGSGRFGVAANAHA